MKQLVNQILFEKYLMSKGMSPSKENTIFSVLLIFSTELALNIITLLIIFGIEDIFSFDDKKNVILLITIPFVIGLVLSFRVLGKKRLSYYVETEKESEKVLKILSICYSMVTYLLFFIFFTRIFGNVVN